jgi:hypothetical protein
MEIKPHAEVGRLDLPQPEKPSELLRFSDSAAQGLAVPAPSVSRGLGFAIWGAVLPLGALPGATLWPEPELVAASFGAAPPGALLCIEADRRGRGLAICGSLLPLGALPGAMLGPGFPIAAGGGAVSAWDWP